MRPPDVAPAPPGSFAPLRRPVFVVLWAASVLGNTGTFMRDVASAWLVTDLSPSPAAVAAVQAAGMLPIFLLAIPAGVLSDIVDRRRLLIAIQLLLGAVSAALMAISLSGMMSVPALIALTFLGGIGAALMGPTWQSIVPELVPRAQLRGAVALSSMGMNIARAIGPAVGGMLVAAFGAAAAYGADVASYVVVIAALLWWRRPSRVDDALRETFGGAFRAGLRYALASRELHVVLLRAAVFLVFSSALWALLPLVTRELLQADAAFYGLLLGAVGTGALLGAIALPLLRRLADSDGLVFAAAVAAGIGAFVLALAPPRAIAIAVLLVMGTAWIVALTTLNTCAQAILPNWVRGRGLAVYLTVFNGAMAAGTLGWGIVAQRVGIVATLLIAATGMIISATIAHRIRLPSGEDDLAPSNHWQEPLIAEPIEGDRGPVLVLVEYRVRREDQPAFLAALARHEAVRRRDGAFAWGAGADSAEPDRIVEWFCIDSWAEHLRQHRRATHADADLHDELRRFHQADAPPVVRHLLGFRT